jgi:hydroxymethylbilane synthase
MKVGSETRATIRVGTRGSLLARWQANWVAEQLRKLHAGLTVELVEIKTLGDRDQNSSLGEIGGAGVFTKEIQRALLDKRVDLAVHSLKDLPVQQSGELLLAAVPAREDLSDALIAPVYKTLDALPHGARIGSGSPRRRAQILCMRRDLEVVSLRGNIETRLKYAQEGHLHGVLLACAGLRRLGLEHQISQRLEPPEFLPAVGQGALGLECRSDDEGIARLVKPLNHDATHRAVLAERAVLAALQGGCALPIAAWARGLDGFGCEPADLVLAIDAGVFALDGSRRVVVSLQGSGQEPEVLGRKAAQSLIAGGASALLG